MDRNLTGLKLPPGAVSPPPELTDEEINRLHEISERCPVNKTLQSEVQISSFLDKS